MRRCNSQNYCSRSQKGRRRKKNSGLGLCPNLQFSLWDRFGSWGGAVVVSVFGGVFLAVSVMPMPESDGVLPYKCEFLGTWHWILMDLLLISALVSWPCTLEYACGCICNRLCKLKKTTNLAKGDPKSLSRLHVHLCVCVYVYMYICMYVWVFKSKHCKVTQGRGLRVGLFGSCLDWWTCKWDSWYLIIKCEK